MPPTITFAPPPTQPFMTLSKLVKEAKQLGCQTFSSTIDVVAAKKWLRRVSDTLSDMELDDELKLKIVTRLSDKSAAT